MAVRSPRRSSTDRIAELTATARAGSCGAVQLTVLDPYLWKLQVGGKRLVQKARQSGAPIDGVVVSAGIPELEEAVALIEELNEVGISHVVFKPGTVEQIRRSSRSPPRCPTKPVIVHIEGGRAGGHHSWEDLDDLLLATYAELRKLSNITICVGGGIGTPQRAAEYLSGTWSLRYGFPIDAGRRHSGRHRGDGHAGVDYVSLGQAAAGRDHRHPRWVGAGKAQGGMASGRSQLGADIHEIDNAASRCGRLLDEVAGDADAVADRRDELIAAMANTAKPYFGDVGDMTYLQWLQRFVELSIGDGDSTADTASPGSPWLADTWRDRFARDAQARRGAAAPAGLRTDRDSVRRRAEGQALLENPDQAIASLLARYPDAETSSCIRRMCRSSSRCARRRVSRSTSCRLSTRTCGAGGAATRCGRPMTRGIAADQVCIIPGTQSVAGITRVDEPVGELLDRFEQAAIDGVLASAAEPTPVVSRRQARADVTGALAVVLDSPDVLWAGRTAINPVHRIGAPDEWQVNQNRSATHPSTGARLDVVGDHAVVLNVPLSGTWIDIRFTLTDVIRDGGAPVVSVGDAAAAMRSVLAIAAGVDGPESLPAVYASIAR